MPTGKQAQIVQRLGLCHSDKDREAGSTTGTVQHKQHLKQQLIISTAPSVWVTGFLWTQEKRLRIGSYPGLCKGRTRCSWRVMMQLVGACCSWLDVIVY